MGYRHLGGKLLGVTIKSGGTEAMVMIRATIDTIVGKSEQTETYLLFLVERKWLIDEVIITDEIDVEELEKGDMYLHCYKI
jgi:hypothetical protein